MDTFTDFRRYNNDPINWYTNFYDNLISEDECYNIGDEIDYGDLLNPENPYGFYYVIMINSEDVFRYNQYNVDANGLPELFARYISTVTDNGNILDFREAYPDGSEDGTASTTFQRASNEFNDFADIPFPCP